MSGERVEVLLDDVYSLAPSFVTFQIEIDDGHLFFSCVFHCCLLLLILFFSLSDLFIFFFFVYFFFVSRLDRYSHLPSFALLR